MTPPFAKKLEAAQQCVLCGMCLPHCPTYGQLQSEGDSPRGRINLMLGLAQGSLDPGSERLREHIEGCLGCRSCEAICPAEVPFSSLMDTTRAILHESTPHKKNLESLRTALLTLVRNHVLRHPRLLAIGALAARTAAQWQVGKILPASSALGRTLRHLHPALVENTSPQSAADFAEGTAPEVLVFTGCMESFFSRQEAQATLEILAATGISARKLPGQVCCGALDRHLGFIDSADEFRKQNLKNLDVTQPVIVLDSGCQAELDAYGDATDHQPRIHSLTEFLNQLPEERLAQAFGLNDCSADSHPGLQAKNSLPPPARIALHLPCTLRNVLRGAKDLERFLLRLPGVEIITLEPVTGCCGAGGTAMLTHPAMADALGASTLTALTRKTPDCIVTANVGCRIHLQGLAGQQNQTIPIWSPARFLQSRLIRTLPIPSDQPI